jgi:hypothetical protein
MNHQELAIMWINFNGLKVTEKRIAQTMKTPAFLLERMLRDRKVI